MKRHGIAGVLARSPGTGGMLALLVAAGCLGGCASTSKGSRQADSHLSENWAITGSVSLPSPSGAVSLPVEFLVDRRASETTDERSIGQTKSTFDGAAIGQQLAAGFAAALKQAVPALNAIGSLGAASPPPTDWGRLSAEALAVLTAIYGIAKSTRDSARASESAKRADEQQARAEEHKADAAEGWAEFKRLALERPSPTT